MFVSMIHRARIGPVLVLIGLIAAACSGAGETAAPVAAVEPEPTTSTSEAEPEPEEPSITKEDFLERGNAICETGATEIEADPNSNAPGPQFFIGTVIPSIRQQMDDMRALGYPDGDEELIDTMFDDTETILSDIEANPDTVGTGPNPFADVNQRLADYGLTVCADG